MNLFDICYTIGDAALKKLLFTAFVILLLTSASLISIADDADEVPEKIKAAFSAMFPDVKEVKWEIEEEDGIMEFEAEFEDGNGLEGEIEYDADGNLIELEKEIMPEELPVDVAFYLAANYKGFEIEEAVKIINRENEFYEIEFTVDGEEHEITLDKMGYPVEDLMDEE